MIPDEVKAVYCYGDMKDRVIVCEWYILSDCPNACAYARRIKQGIAHTSRTGLERFLDKWSSRWRKDKIIVEDYQI